MEIVIKTQNPDNIKPRFYGDKQRLATITSVRLINESTLVCANFVDKMLYLIHFDYNSYTILDTIHTEANGHEYCSELMDYNPNTSELIVSVYNSILLLYNISITDNKIHYVRCIEPSAIGPIHGVKFHPNIPNVFVVATIHRKNTAGIYFVNLDGDILLNYHSGEWYCKDIAFTNDSSHIIGIFSNGKVETKTAKGYNTKICVFKIENNLLPIQEEYINGYHCDACVYKSGKLYMTLQGLEYGEVRIYDVDKNNIQLSEVIPKLNFPHGIDVLDNNIAITSYGNSSVIITSNKK